MPYNQNKVSKIQLPLFWLIVTCIIVYANAIYAKAPLAAMPWQWADDGLYWHQALGIQKWLSGQSNLWLGEYSKMALYKAPGFAIFLVIINTAGIPLQVAQFFLFVFLAFFIFVAIRPIYKPGIVAKIVILFLIICYPSLPNETRLLRNIFSSALTGYFLISLVGLILRAEAPLKRQAAWAASSGLFLSLCYLCREEGIWLVAPAFFAIAFMLCLAWYNKKLLDFTLIPVTLIGFFLCPVCLVCILNFNSYGAFVTTERRAPQFVNAFKLLASLEPANLREYVPMPEKTRLKVYQESPSFAKLQPYLEGKMGDEFAKNPGHLALSKAKPDEREFFASTYEFALKFALWEFGLKTFKEQESFWRSVTVEVEKAVSEGRLKQGAKPLSLCVPLREGDLKKIFYSAFKSFENLFYLKGVAIPCDPRSSGNEADVVSMGVLANSLLAPMNTSAFKLENNTPIRSKMFAISNSVIQLFYAIGFLSILFWCSFIIRLWLSGNLHIIHIQWLACIFMCLITLTLYCLMMAFLEVAGFPHLENGGSYNNMGIIILGINSCLGFISILYFAQNLHKNMGHPQQIDEKVK